MPVDLPTLVAAALAGVLGGAHCAVMCGGIAAGFPAMAPGRPLAVAWQANLGRIGGYVVAGAVAGGLGGGLLRLVRIEALTTGVRMAAGLALVLVALRLLDRRAEAIARAAGPFGHFGPAMRAKADQIAVVSRFKFTREQTLETSVR